MGRWYLKEKKIYSTNFRREKATQAPFGIFNGIKARHPPPPPPRVACMHSDSTQQNLNIINRCFDRIQK